jgi:hypothetical protein
MWEAYNSGIGYGTSDYSPDIKRPTTPPAKQ